MKKSVGFIEIASYSLERDERLKAKELARQERQKQFKEKVKE